MASWRWLLNYAEHSQKANRSRLYSYFYEYQMKVFGKFKAASNNIFCHELNYFDLFFNATHEITCSLPYYNGC